MTQVKVSLFTDTSCGDYAVPLAPAHYSDTDSDLERTEDYVFLQVIQDLFKGLHKEHLSYHFLSLFQEPAVSTLPGSLGTGRVPQIGEEAVQLNTLLSQVLKKSLVLFKYTSQPRYLKFKINFGSNLFLSYGTFGFTSIYLSQGTFGIKSFFISGYSWFKLICLS